MISRVVRGGGETAKATHTWFVAAIIAAVVVVAGLGVLWANRRDENSDYSAFWTPTVGSYAILRQTNETLFNFNWTMKVTIVSLNATTAMRDEAWYTEFGGVYVENTWPAPVNLTFPNGFDIRNNMGWPVDVTEVGVDKLQTPWGERTCLHYEAQWSSNFGGFLDHFWVHNGIMVKTIGPPGEGYQGGTWVLEETNIPEVTHQS